MATTVPIISSTSILLIGGCSDLDISSRSLLSALGQSRPTRQRLAASFHASSADRCSVQPTNHADTVSLHRIIRLEFQKVSKAQDITDPLFRRIRYPHLVCILAKKDLWVKARLDINLYFAVKKALGQVKEDTELRLLIGCWERVKLNHSPT